MNLFNNSDLFKPTFLRVIWFSSKMTLPPLTPDVILFLLHNPRNYRMPPNSPLNHKESASISDKILMIQSVTHSLTQRPFLFQFDSNKRRTHLRRTIPKSTVEEGRRAREKSAEWNTVRVRSEWSNGRTFPIKCLFYLIRSACHCNQ